MFLRRLYDHSFLLYTNENIRARDRAFLYLWERDNSRDINCPDETERVTVAQFHEIRGSCLVLKKRHIHLLF